MESEGAGGRFQLAGTWIGLRSGSPFWQLCWYDATARQTRKRSTGTRDFEAAKVQLARYVLSNAPLHDAAPGEVPVKALLDRYYAQHTAKLPSAKYARYALGIWERSWGRCVVGELTHAGVEAWTAELRAGGHSPASVNRVLSVGRAALTRAHKRGELASVPHIPQLPVTAPRLPRATPADLAALLNSAGGPLAHVRDWLVLSLATLGRPAAVLALTAAQVDLGLSRIDLNPPGRPQNRKARPVVPLPASLAAWVARLVAGAPEGPLVTYDSAPLASIREGFRKATRRAGVPPGTTPYTIRRTMATELRRRGVPPWEVAGYLGHAARSFATTEVYAEYAPDYLGAAARAIDAYVAELRPMLDFEVCPSTGAAQ